MSFFKKREYDPSLLAAYKEHSARDLSKSVTIANIIALVGMPSGITLDYFLYPAQLPQFVAIRFGVDFVLLLINGLLFLSRANPKLWQVKTLGVLSALIINGSFCLMIFITEGAKSPYFAGLILVSMLWSTLLPWTVVQTLVMFAGSIMLYVVACLAHSTASGGPLFALIGFNISFLLITCIVGSGTTFFQSRARLEEFSLRHQLDVQNRELQDLDRLKTQFFSNVSHELRTPLTLILGPAQTLLSHGDSLDPKVHEGLLLIHRNTLRLLKLINDLLDLTRLDQGAEILRPKTVAVGTFVRGIVESVRHLARSKNLRLRLEAGDAAQNMTVDPVRLEKVLINLLTNAIKYTPAGGAITVRWAGGSEGTAIEVQDTGVGIPQEDLAKIFDRFHQVRGNAANLTQGVGIGLALARELVERHGGKLEVESQPGQGATFRVRLPLAAESEAVAEVETEPVSEEPFENAFRSADRSWRAPAEEGDLPVVGRGERLVLVADDEVDMREYVVGLLAEDHRVVQTQHGGNVSALVREHRPGLVLLDWMMPGKDGLAVCRELRADPLCQDLKIVLLTARIDEASKLEALRAGADDFLTKPFSSIEVKTRVANLLRVGQLQQDLRGRNDKLTETIAKLQRTETMLIQSEKMNAIGSLSAGLLHEINNPLNYTLAAINFAGQFKDTLNDEMKEILADVEEGMVRIRDVVTDLKNFAYPEKPGAESDFSLAEVFQAARKIVAGEIGDITLDVDLPETLVVRGQKTQMMHVFINLLNNAARALKRGPVHGSATIFVNGSSCDEMAMVEVADNGPGVPEDIKGRIFDPFFTTQDVGSGMGMGLSICHTIMESHQGSIRVGNRAEGGAVFTFSLPLVKEAQTLC
jgi:signal transduction histidine kinase